MTVEILKVFEIDKEKYPKGYEKLKDITKEVQTKSKLSLEQSSVYDSYIINAESSGTLLGSFEDKITSLKMAYEECNELIEDGENFVSFYKNYEELKEDFLNDIEIDKRHEEKIDYKKLISEIEEEFGFLFNACNELKEDTLKDFKEFKEKFKPEKKNLKNKLR